MLGVDYVRARKVLRDRRFELRMGVNELADASGVNRVTIYHLEKVEKEPDHKPDLDTLERLATAMDLTLAQFFARIEGLQAQTLSDKDPHISTESGSGANSVVSARRPLDDPGALLYAGTSATVALTKAIRELTDEIRTAREQTATARHHTPRKNAGNRGAR